MVRDFSQLSPALQNEREALEEACFAAYKRNGTVACDEWRAAARACSEHKVAHGGDYNPD